MATKELVKELAEALSESMLEYRKAEKRDPDYSDIKVFNLTEDLDKTIEELHYRGGIYSEYNLNMTSVQYWKDIIRAQINIIGMTGGKSLMEQVYQELENVDGGPEHNYQSLFSVCADGLHNWYN